MQAHAPREPRRAGSTLAAALLAEHVLSAALAWFAGPAAWYGRWSDGEARCDPLECAHSSFCIGLECLANASASGVMTRFGALHAMRRLLLPGHHPALAVGGAHLVPYLQY